jgi:SNF2 family DNA or RNA helicase
MRRSDLHTYQSRAVDYICEKQRCALWLFMGAGKSVISLTAVSDMIEASIIRRALIIGPLRVVTSVWSQEARKWSHLKHLKIAIATGSVKQRKAALDANTDVVAINRENVPWLVKNFPWDFDAVIIDESSSFKSSSALRFRALKKVIPKSNVVILLSGTPAPNSLIDLWSQIFLIDGGNALEKNITAFRRKYCEVDFWGHKWTVKEGNVVIIQNLIKPLTLSMQGDDYLELPDKIDIIEKVVLPEKVMKQYKDFEKELFLEFEGVEIEALSAAVLAGRLLQFTSGAIYHNEEHDWTHIHNAKLDALAEIIEENPNENVLIAYGYKHALARILKRFPEAVVLDKAGKALEAWNRGEIKMLVVHPMSAGHGINAQYGGSMLVWYDLPWSLEAFLQTIARLHRQGQEKPVRVVHLVADGTIDARVLDVLRRKDSVQSDLLKALRR